MCDLYAGSKGSRGSGLLIQYVGWHWKPFSVVWQIPDEVSQNDWSSPQSPFCRNILAMSPGCGLVMKTFVFNSPQWTSLPWIHPIAFRATREFTIYVSWQGEPQRCSALHEEGCPVLIQICWFHVMLLKSHPRRNIKWLLPVQFSFFTPFITAPQLPLCQRRLEALL